MVAASKPVFPKILWLEFFEDSEFLKIVNVLGKKKWKTWSLPTH